MKKKKIYQYDFINCYDIPEEVEESKPRPVKTVKKTKKINP